MTNTNQSRNDISIVRIFDAPRELVWKAWSEPELFMHWWGPKNFTSPSNRTDFREGGTYLWSMKSPDGQMFWTTGVFREIVKLTKIAFTDSFADEKGSQVPASHYGMDGDVIEEYLVSVSFEDHANGKTKMILIHAGLPVGDMASVGWNESFDKLAELLGDQKA